jgi:hypothetical protein
MEVCQVLRFLGSCARTLCINSWSYSIAAQRMIEFFASGRWFLVRGRI